MGSGVSLSVGTLLLVAELSLGVAPFSVLGLSEEECDELRQVTLELLTSQRRGRQVIAPDVIDAAITDLELGGEELRSCLDEGPCAARIARRANADQLIVGSAAGLGRTYILRLNFVDAEGGVIDYVQQTVEGGIPDLSEALTEQVNRFLGPPPLYRRWWFWTAIGAFIFVAAAVVTAVVLTLPEDSQLDTYPLP